ncbi:MAG: DUF255 domain-containing protein [Halobaculum sp.]
MTETDDGSRVEWREWGADAFDVAERTGKPVLLWLTATWCDDCHEMAAETFGEPRIAANVNDGFVPIRVDVDRHPRVRERYNMGGFPTTAFLTPEGELLTEAGRVPRALAGNETPSGPLDAEIGRHFAGQLDSQWDDDHAGWGTDAKFPLPRTVEFALKRDRSKATRTLDAIRRNLQGEDGGFARYAAGQDWSDPHRERLLDANAGLLRAFANGYLYTGDESYQTAASDAADYLRSELRVGDSYGGSVGPAGDRRDLTAYAGGNALLADALLTFSAYTDDEQTREDARGILRYLRSDLIDAESGRVVHFREDDLAATVADRAITELGDEDGFRDGPASGPGMLDKPLRPIDGTVELAEGLLDLAALTGEDGYSERAEQGLSAFAGAADRMGAQVAGYGSAVERCLSGPLVVAVGTEPGSDLHRAALRVADHEKVVVPNATDVPAGTATVRDRDVEPAETPAALMERVADATGR